MSNVELNHTGVLGMKWGVRRNPAQLARTSTSTKKKTQSNDADKKTSSSKKASEMTDAELKEKVSRLQLEKQYKDLMPKEAAKISKGKQFVAGVLEQSGKEVAKQLVTYALGSAINKAAKTDIINVKKSSKDK